MDTAQSGLTLGLAAVLAVAAVAKTARPIGLELALVQLLPRGTWRVRGVTSRTLARALTFFELGLSLALLLAGDAWRLAVVAVAALVFTVFLVATLFARQRRVSCGCMGSPKRAATMADVLRAGFYCASAIVVLGATARHGGVLRLSATTVLIALAMLFVFFVPAVLDWARAAITKSRAEPTGLAGPSGSRFSRRSALQRGVGALAALAGIVVFAPAAPALACIPPTPNLAGCNAWFDQCYDCCGGVLFVSCIECCQGCLEKCLDGASPCPTLSCFGCWPGA